MLALQSAQNAGSGYNEKRLQRDGDTGHQCGNISVPAGQREFVRPALHARAQFLELPAQVVIHSRSLF